MGVGSGQGQDLGPAEISELEVIAEEDSATQGLSKDWGQLRGPPRTPCSKASTELERPQETRGAQVTQEPEALGVTRRRDNNSTQHPRLAPKSCHSSPLGTVGSQLIVSGTWRGGGDEYYRLFRLLFSAR